MQVTHYFLGNILSFAIYLAIYLAIPFDNVHFSIKAILGFISGGLFYATLEACINESKRVGPVLSPVKRRAIGAFSGLVFGIVLGMIGGQPIAGLVFASLFFGGIGFCWKELSKVM